MFVCSLDVLIYCLLAFDSWLVGHMIVGVFVCVFACLLACVLASVRVFVLSCLLYFDWLFVCACACVL